MFEKILVCLDGSPLSEQIMPYIIEEARCFSKVVLLRVLATPETAVPMGVPGVPGLPVYTEATLRAYQREADEAPAYLEKIAGSLREKGLDVESVVQQGLAGETIINYADANDIKLIALATHGRGGLKRLVFGSTADYVLRRSGLPILLVRPRE